MVDPGHSPRNVYLNPVQYHWQQWSRRWCQSAPRLARMLALVMTFVLFAPVQAAGRQNVEVVWSNDTPLGGYQFGDFNGDGKTDLFRVAGSQWQYSPGGVSPWINLASDPSAQNELRFGDFNGDGKTDVFSRAPDGRWRYSDAGASNWINLALDVIPLSELRFGDFDGDGKTDVFSVAVDGRWRYSSGGISGWIPLAIDSLAVTDLRFGFFDADDKTDVFSRAMDGRWRYSSGGAGSWTNLALDPAPINELALGDFNGDDITDVFNRTSAGQWRYSASGTGSWINLAGDSTAFSDLRFGDFDGDGKTDVFSLGPDGQPRYSSGGLLNWTNLTPDPTPTPTLTPTPTGTTLPPTTAISSLEFGDFDGDGRTDVFRIVSGQWQFSSAGIGQWQNLATDPLPLSDLRFGDFNGDRRTDVFSVASNGRWRYSNSGTSAWIDLAIDTLPVGELRFGDFNGDGKTDVFSRAPDGQWRYSDGGVSAWINLATDPLPLSDLRFGDFNGDGKTDVFSVAPDGRWRYSDGGVSAWINLAIDSLPVSELRFGDFNGDGKTDVFSRAPDGRWRYSDGGVSAWINLAIDPLPLSDLRFGDFNGDGKTDVFSIAPDGRWRYSSGGESSWILLGPPDMTTITPPPTITGAPPTGCMDILENGSFETNSGWMFGDSPVPGKYTGANKRSGNRAVQLGIPPELPMVNSYSSIRQMVMPGYNVSTLTLRWWQWMRTDEGINNAPTSSQDRLDVILLTPSGDTLKILRRIRTNENGWTPVSLDITEMAGQSFYVYFNVYNDGGGGRTWMLMDDVVLEACPGAGPMPADKSGWGDPGMSGPNMGGPNIGDPYMGGSGMGGPARGGPSMGGPHKPGKGGWMPTETPTFTPTPTATPTSTPTITPTATLTSTTPITDTPDLTNTNGITVDVPISVSVAPLPPAELAISGTPVPEPAAECVELINNGDFEVNDIGWSRLPGPASPIYSTELAFNGSSQAIRLGIAEGENVASISAIDQVVVLPMEATSIILSFRYFPLMETPPGPGDLQYVDVYDVLTSQFAARALGVQANDRMWLAVDNDLTGLAGQTIRLVMAVNNDGVEGRTAMYIDNVSLTACRFENIVTPGNTVPEDQNRTEPGSNAPRPVAQAPIVLESREPAATTSGLWLSRFAAVGVLASVVGVIGFAAMVLIGSLRAPD